ncbi:MAG: alpha/beta fold hydrolase [Candidatus Thermoplasmatota archaeon]|nr:alpha/beta fold hydrolase [Candidatus Thermoplasmatota archaeon]
MSEKRARKGLRRGRAAAYEKTPVNWAPTIPGFLMTVIPLELLALAALPEWRASQASWLLLGTTLPFAGWLFVYWKIYLSVFVTASANPAEPIDPRWKPFTFMGWGDETLKAYLLESDEKREDLLLFLHGYGSCLSRGESRPLHIHSMGVNVISLDQRGFGSQKGRVDWTLLKVIADIEGLLEEAPSTLGFKPQRLWIYGHSMGGFITIRLASHHSGWWGDALQGIILESPAASFPKIIDSNLPGRMVMARPWVRQVLRREHERIHPDLNVRYANSELPYCGIPDVPALVVQAEHDETLGTEHFALIREHMAENSEIHVLDMPHTSTVETDDLRSTVETCMEKQLGYNRSVS